LEPDRVKELSRELGSLVHREFDIPPDRLYIEFSDIKPSMWGWNSTPFG
jgi:phenylpyruvate tautomerase